MGKPQRVRKRGWGAASHGERGLLFASSQEVLTWLTPQRPLSLAQFSRVFSQGKPNEASTRSLYPRTCG